MSNVNGETLKASESGLISKVKQRMRPFGEAAEETMRLARRAANLPAVDGRAWRRSGRTRSTAPRASSPTPSSSELQSGHRVACVRPRGRRLLATQIEQLERDDLTEAGQVAAAA
jgi:hypothetical protein